MLIVLNSVSSILVRFEVLIHSDLTFMLMFIELNSLPSSLVHFEIPIPVAIDDSCKRPLKL